MNPNSNSPQLQAANKALRRTLKPMLRFIPSQRFINWLSHMRPPTKGRYYDAAQTDWVDLGGIECLKVTPDKITSHGTKILYFHGGAYTIGSPKANEPDARRIAISCGATTYSVKYTTAIHAPYPAAVDDAELAYTALLDAGVPAKNIALAGTSAGGGLVLALIQRLLDKKRPMPACVIALSPWLDLSMSYPSVDELKDADVVLTRAWTTRAAKMYAGEVALSAPEVSPINGHFKGAPPMLILYSKLELFRDEIENFAATLEGFGVQAEIHAHYFAPHGWPMVVEDAPETEEAFTLIADYLTRQTSNDT